MCFTAILGWDNALRPYPPKADLCFFDSTLSDFPGIHGLNQRFISL